MLVCTLGCEQSAPNQQPVTTGRKADGGHVSSVNMRVPASASAAPVAPPKPGCPDDMALITGGTFWVGSTPGAFAADESPRHKTTLATFCLDITEVTVDAYAQCASAGTCSRSGSRGTCNAGFRDRGNHPINCVDWRQSVAYCGWRKRRLPTEAEWEFAARAGERYLKYPWGNETPDGRACWKEPTTCPVKSFEAGAFGVYDLSGNVWEWTASGYGDYPWPPVSPLLRVYRGGSYSRRFEKWMHTRLRNRWSEHESGSHLGFRCAMRAPGESCPFGEDGTGECLYGVLEAECEAPLAWTGARCAPQGAPRCRPGAQEQPGHGCGRANADAGGKRGAGQRAAAKGEAEPKNVARVRTPEFDQDCRTYQPNRPHAYRYEGGTHAARNALGAQAGCKNRDVGVGWNSSCCP